MNSNKCSTCVYSRIKVELSGCRLHLLCCAAYAGRRRLRQLTAAAAAAAAAATGDSLVTRDIAQAATAI